MSERILWTENVSKRFHIAHAGRGDVLDRFTDRLFGRRGLRETFWALKDVNLEVNRGDNFGLVGPNGSGKSTLLKILANIYKPTKGRVGIGGRVIPFLDFGWGILEGEQTGEDNIAYAGTLFGLTRREINEAFDKIVRFAELEQYLHTPLKYYSTGMRIRLTFSIALFSRPEIFLVDEVLAVGDIAFRQKCYDALKGLSRKEETLVFVSHDLPAMREFCDRGIFLLNGQVKTDGDIDDIIEEYMFGAWARTSSTTPVDRPNGSAVDLLDVKIRDAQGRDRSAFQSWEPVDLSIDVRVNNPVDSLLLFVQASGEDGEYFFGTRTILDESQLRSVGHPIRATLSFPHLPILRGRLLFTISAMNSSMTQVYDRREKVDSMWVVNTTESEGKIDFHPDWRFG